MKIKNILIHNFRSIKNASFNLCNYSMLVGKNNSGKSNILAAIRIFYEDGGLKYNEKRDFPKFSTDDKESWIEIHYATTNEEQNCLKDEYKSSNNILKVRKHLKYKDKDLVKSDQSNLYAYESGTLSKNLFYGAKNISTAKLGRIIFVPAVSKTEDNFKLSGPSPFRDMLNFVMKRSVLNSSTFEILQKSFDKFDKDFRKEASEDGFSINTLVQDINNEIRNWKVTFGININQIKPEDLVKNLLSHYFEDDNLEEKEININYFGQGLQRHLIYTLIKLSSKYEVRKKVKKKEWSPDLVVLLFEEPEAFLHPSQQEIMHLSLQTLSAEQEEQVIISTHSPHFVSKQINDISGIIRLHKNAAASQVFQILDSQFNSLLDENIGLYRKFCDILNNSSADERLKAAIRNKHLGDGTPEETIKLEEESIKYFLWLNPDKSSLFFAEHVIICEGLSDKVFFDSMLDDHCENLRNKHVYVLESGGKFNIHRYMSLLKMLNIPHSVIFDHDSDLSYHQVVNQYISDNKNDLTKEIFFFDNDLEDFLEITKAKRPDLKPINILSQYKKKLIKDEKIQQIKDLLEKSI